MMGSSFLTSAMRMSALCTICTAKAGVHDVAARQAEMKPAAGAVVDFFGDGGGEADDVVVERLFQFLGAFDEALQVGEAICPRRALIFAKSALRHDAFLHQRFAGEQFDLQPDAGVCFRPSRSPAFPGGNSVESCDEDNGIVESLKC